MPHKGAVEVFRHRGSILTSKLHQTCCSVEVHGQSTAQESLLGQRVTYTPSSGLCREMLVGAIRWDGYAQLCHSRWAHVVVFVDLSRRTEASYTGLQPFLMLTATTNREVFGALFRDWRVSTLSQAASCLRMVDPEH